AEKLPTVSAPCREIAARTGRALHDRRVRACERQLKHAPSAAVGDPPHDIESPRDPGDVESLALCKELTQMGTRVRTQSAHNAERGLEPDQVASCRNVG